MTAAQILSDALKADVVDTDPMKHLEAAIRLALPAIKNEVLDAFHEGETSGFASASLVADRVLS